MIPLKLTLENFKCYRRDVPTLHLAGVHIACLCGGNGHGKSSLLDAIAWALWGEAVHRPQEELVHLGEQDMRVELEFEVGGTADVRGQVYRVIRRYTRGSGRTRAGATSLELQVAPSLEVPPRGGTGDERDMVPPRGVSGDERDLDSPQRGTGDEGDIAPPQGESTNEGASGLRSISGNSVRETEAFIRKLVGMDYDTFVNSAFLVQGRAGEFTTKRPADRQRVLGEILGLGFYDRLQERARQKAREHAGDIQRIQGEAQAWTQELARRPEYEEELPRVEADLDNARSELATAQQESATLREQVESLRGQRRELENLGGQRDTAREELEQLQAQASQHGQRVVEWEAVASRETEVVQAFALLTEHRTRDEELNRLLEPYARLQERQGPLSQQVEALPSLEAALVEAQDRLAVVEERGNTLQAQRAQLQEMEVRQQTLTAENQRLRQEMDGLRSKVDMLSEGDARCPLCGTELGEEGKEHIAAEYEAQGKLFAQQHRQNTATLGDMEPRHRELATAAEKEEKELSESRRQLHGRIAALGQQLEEARKAPTELATLTQELAGLGYDPSAHQEVKEAIQKLASAAEDHRLLQQATEGLPRERDNLGRVTALTKRREEAITQAEERMAAIRKSVEALPALERQMEGVETRCRTLQERQQEAVARHGFLEARLREYIDTEAKKAEAEAELSRMAGEREVFEQLATAFGRTGVQALLVEAAMPELEVEANRLLGRMTDNTMHLKLETQRESQRGEQVETLEIKVADALGTRSYETFSGGEAFRINLALRIALSKLLAHRAGAPLPTLFIDEGFGTQDAPGRERILDVIQSIAEDFQCILVITHMDEVKDAFPVRIEVRKTPSGSTFALT